MITDEMVRDAIKVLEAYVTEETMPIDETLMAELTDAIDVAYNGPITCDLEIDPPLNLG